MIGASAGTYHTAVWTDANEIFTFGSGFDREFGHLDVDEEDEEEEDPFGLLDGRETLKPPKDHCRSHGSRRIEPSEGPAPRLLPRLVEALLTLPYQCRSCIIQCCRGGS